MYRRLKFTAILMFICIGVFAMFGMGVVAMPGEVIADQCLEVVDPGVKACWDNPASTIMIESAQVNCLVGEERRDIYIEESVITGEKNTTGFMINYRKYPDQELNITDNSTIGNIEDIERLFQRTPFYLGNVLYTLHA